MNPSELTAQELLELRSQWQKQFFSQQQSELLAGMGSLGSALAEALARGAEEIHFETGLGASRGRMSYEGPGVEGKAGELVALSDWLSPTRRMIERSEGGSDLFFKRSMLFSVEIPMGELSLTLRGRTMVFEDKRVMVALSLDQEESLEAFRAQLEKEQIDRQTQAGPLRFKPPGARL